MASRPRTPQPSFDGAAHDHRPGAEGVTTERGRTRTWMSLIGSIRIGQAVITVVLTVIGVIRALSDGVPVPWAIAVAVVFLGWYAGGLLLSERTDDRVLATWWLIGLAAIWLGAVAVSPEFVWLAFPLWLLAGFAMRMRWALLLSAIVLAAVIVAPLLHTGTTTYANVIGPLVGGLFALGISRGYLELVRDARERRRLIASLVQTQAEMAALQDELARTQRESGASSERTRLSRDIHDTVAQSVSSIALLASAAIDEGSPEQATVALGQIQELAREVLSDTRRIVNALMPAELENTPLAGALGRMLERMRAETGIRAELHVDDSLPALSTVAEVALLRTAQSALANVRTHAGAQRVVVNLMDAGDTVRLDIADDGRGFDAERWNELRVRTADSGYGLRSMRDRLRELGGGLEIESAPGDGTALSAHLPLGGVGTEPDAAEGVGLHE